MAQQMPPKPVLPATIYASLAGGVDAAMVQRIFTSGAVAINAGVKTLHIVFHSSGGTIPDGVAMYNYFRGIPLDLHFYNIGTVASIGVIAFLGARHRYASANATFMIHKSHFNISATTDAARASGMANSLKIEDARTRAILENHLKLSKRRLERHLNEELPFTAQAALDCGLITAIQDFQLPPSTQISNI